MKVAQKIKNGIKSFETSAKDIGRLRNPGKCKKDDVATFVFGKFKRKVSLKRVRFVLVLLNTIVLVASAVSFSAWRAAKHDWKGDNVHVHLLLDPLEDLPAMPNQEELLIKAVHSYLDHILCLTALNLFLYWIIYGVIVSSRFGGACEIWTLVMSLPHTVMMVIWEVGVAVAVLRVIVIMTNLPWDELGTVHHHNYNAARYAYRFYVTWGPWLAASYIAAVPVQVFTMSLPFFLTQLPYQRDIEIGDQECVKSRGNFDNAKANTLAKDKEASKRSDDGSDYVGGDQLEQISRDRISSIYQCEMPAEKIAKMKALQKTPFTRVRKLSASAGRSVIDTMNSVYHVHHSQAPVWNILKNENPHPKLAGGQTLAGGVSIFPQHDDYVDMEETNYDDYMSDLPNMKLYPQ
eukprot:GFUD01013817.1.p1 GENE.GFUD01013817.1~~GFUD01013817.1.p1  ORF type:complete len:405 (-),score=96.59 GFUD01013817.1:315-1529(-)